MARSGCIAWRAFQTRADSRDSLAFLRWINSTWTRPSILVVAVIFRRSWITFGTLAGALHKDVLCVSRYVRGDPARNIRDCTPTCL